MQYSSDHLIYEHTLLKKVKVEMKNKSRIDTWAGTVVRLSEKVSTQTVGQLIN